MSTAYWCILAAAVLPYFWYTVARALAGRIDNHDPRLGMAQLAEGRARRANNAQYNAFEAFAPFAAAVLMAQFAGVDAARITQLAVVDCLFVAVAQRTYERSRAHVARTFDAIAAREARRGR